MKSVLTIGSYDGIHTGHQKIINTLKVYSNRYNLKSVVIFFKFPPKLILTNRLKDNVLTMPDEKREILEKFNIDILSEIEFNDKIHKLSAEVFFEKYIYSKYKPCVIVVGKDFSIGKNREGNLLWLKRKAQELKIELVIMDFVKYTEHKISSSLIRTMLHSDDVETANKCLGREYSVEGFVVRGAQLGRKIGFPTANLQIPEEKLLPKGIYITKTIVDNKTYMSVASIGKRPTLKTMNSALIPEVHILNFNKDIYGKKIKVLFYKKIRNEKKFNSLNDLINEIKTDIEKTKKYFNKTITCHKY